MATQHQSDASVATRSLADEVWVTLVWNDPVNLMTYVTKVFQTYFGWTKPVAERHMLEVHELGKSVVASGGREQMEVVVLAMHGYGLWATMQRSDA